MGHPLRTVNVDIVEAAIYDDIDIEPTTTITARLLGNGYERSFYTVRKVEMTLGVWTTIAALKAKTRTRSLRGSTLLLDGKMLDEDCDKKTCEECGIKTDSILVIC